MKYDSLNKWLSLFANLGVLIGIVFLVIEIRQANLIAERDARIDSVSQSYELQKSFLENSDVAAVMAKLASSDANLSPAEEFQAESYAHLLVREAAGLNMNYETGFITGDVLQRHLANLRSNIRRAPGVRPYLENAFEEIFQPQGVTGPVLETLIEELDRLK